MPNYGAVSWSWSNKSLRARDPTSANPSFRGARSASPESTTTIGHMDSGPAPKRAHPGMTIVIKATHMLTTANPFDCKTILDGIRRWVEIETPTEAPAQVNKLATLVADGYRDLPSTIERVAGQSGCVDHIMARSAWGQ